MKAPGELLDVSVERAARWLALGLLDETRAAYARLATPEDGEALHDFRVALRRLRSTLRAYRGYLDESVGKKDRRRLKALGQATGGARDAEVQIQWLEKRLDQLSDGERAGAAWLLERLRQERTAAEAALRQEVAQGFPRERWRLARRLRFLRVEVALDDPTGGPRLGAALARLAGELADDLARHLARVRTATDQAEAHQARIAAKRLRYLLEPFRDALEDGVEAIRRLKALQDGLGELHDVQVLRERVSAVLDEAVPPWSGAEPDPRPGLRTLAGLLERERAERFAAVEAEWLGERGAAGLETVRVACRVGAGPAPLEIERKFLLRRMPKLSAAARVEEIEQGWLPGERLVERLRRVRTPGGTRFYRTVKVGTGLQRLELEEETTDAVFRRLWPLTRGKRVRKLRYKVPDGELTWEIDRFRGHRLVLAEVELPREDTPVALPAWLRRHVVREVTGEAEFQNVNLAR